jgi:hypothetical protein
MIDRQQIIVDDHALGGLRPVEAVDPLPMGPRPVPPAVVQPTAQEPLAQAMATPLQIGTGIITRPTQVANRFLLRRRRPDLRQQPGAQPLRQFARIATIGLNPVARRLRHERRRDDWTALTRAVVACRCSASPHGPASYQRCTGPGASRSSLRTNRRTAFGSFGTVQLTGVVWSPISIAMKRSFLCASTPTYVVPWFMTGSYRVRLWRRTALTRDLGGIHHLVECDSTTTLR